MSRWRHLWSWMMWKHGIDFASEIGYPVVLRPAYTLGGSGGGIADNEEELMRDPGERSASVPCGTRYLVERCIAGWKEIEYEVMRDGDGNCDHRLQYGKH